MATHTDPPAAEGGENARPRGMDTLTFRKDQSELAPGHRSVSQHKDKREANLNMLLYVTLYCTYVPIRM